MTERNDTLNWYRENAEEFISRTETVDMSALYDRFLSHVPAGGRVMDLGCGAGNAALHFSTKGYDVLAVDGCPELCEHTRLRVGCQTRVLRFEELDYENAFDGVWACASLLHLRMNELPRVLRLIRRSLKSGGVFYASFKHGETERDKNGRVFSDMTESSLHRLIDDAGGFRDVSLWTTGDARPDRADEKWVNLLCYAE